MRKNIVIASAIICIVAAILIVQSQFGISKAAEFQKGMHYVTWSKKGYQSDKSVESISKIKSLNANWLAVLTTWYQNTCFSTEIFPTEKTPTDESLKFAIKTAHEKGLKVMLKPHLDILDASYGGWRGEITCAKETDWTKWFQSYEKFIMHNVAIANEMNVEMFCIGTELTEAALAKPEMWRVLIGKVRKVYKGQLTYAANWNEEYTNIAFWDALDYAGVDAYFPLSDKQKPTYEELMEGWKKWLPEIEKWQASIKKPVIFPEIGYHSSEYAAKEPWAHISGNVPDMDVQVNCYKAVFDTFWDKPWFYGTYWWDWGTSVKMGGMQNRGFTPQNKPAESLIKEQYAKKR